MKKHIPNILTCINLLAGFMGIVLLMNAPQEYSLAFFCLAISAICDFLDGFAARALKVHSIIGKDLDSLADLVSFGVLPAIVVFQILYYSIYESGIGANNPIITTILCGSIAGTIVVFSALRLAKFNNDTRQQYDFIGLPTPANAIFWIGVTAWLPSSSCCEGACCGSANYGLVATIIGLVVVFNYLLVSEIPILSMKMQNYTWKNNIAKYIFLIITVFLGIFLQEKALSPVIITLIIVSIGNKIIDFKKNK